MSFCTANTANSFISCSGFKALQNKIGQTDMSKERVRTDNFRRLMEEPSANNYFRLADESGNVCYRGTVFVADRETNTLKLGDCSDKSKCIRVALSGGGSLMVNRDNLGDLNNAITMFSAEDIGRILKAIEQDKMAQGKQMELDEEENFFAQESAAVAAV